MKSETLAASRPPRRFRGRKWLGGIIFGVALLAAYPSWLLWTNNFHVVEAGKLYRSGQMNGTELAAAARRHQLRTVLNLRGPNPGNRWYDEERRACEELGLRHVDFGLSARREVRPREAEQLEALLRELPKPVLVHCNGGSDRTGFVSALYRLKIQGAAPEEAGHELSWRFGYLPYLWWSGSAAMERSFARIPAEASPSRSLLEHQTASRHKQ